MAVDNAFTAVVYDASLDDIQRQIDDVGRQIESWSTSRKPVQSGTADVDFTRSNFRAEGALSVGPIMYDDYVGTVNAGNSSGFSTDFVTPRKARKLPEIPVSFTARVSNGSAGDLAVVGRPRQPPKIPGATPEAAALAATPPEEIPKAVGNRKVFPTIKLLTFDGRLSLESFLAKLEKLFRLLLAKLEKLFRLL